MKSRYNKYNEIAFIEKANILLETLDSFPIILNEYSRVLFSMGMFREALEKSLESDSQMTVLSTNLMTALLYEKIGDDERAETYYLRSIQMAPKVLSSKLLLFNFYRESGDVQQSLEMAKAIRDYPVKVKSSESEQIKLYISDYLSNTLKNEKLL
ncbi:hypothetical protein HP439_02840 [Sphingobacterium shayense]|uniref:tetratricopeptide repeat protein n=1 Tax=Sphingobacterium shayense TaxID=626343 RepID=UPI0015545D95|nr:hypothetical protein [Sphingobacterium shayense]NQD69658.1 hypothetical protein [Sphingobacterium shayense]